MDFELGSEYHALRRMARDFCERELRPLLPADGTTTNTLRWKWYAKRRRPV